MNLRVYERHTSLGPKCPGHYSVLVSNSNGDNESVQEVLASGTDDVLFS